MVAPVATAVLLPALIPQIVASEIGGFIARRVFARQQQENAQVRQNQQTRVLLVDFGASEGLYLDSRTVTFNATWRLVTTFSTILRASGLWKKVGEHNENTWAQSMRDISGGSSWIENRLQGDVIVDFGQ